jgi:hypothetical protein
LKWFEINGYGHSHYNFDIGISLNDKRYGKLRKITEKDLKEVVS